MPTNYLFDPTGFITRLFQGSYFHGAPSWVSSVFSGARTTFIVFDVILAVAFIGVFFASLKYRPHLSPRHALHKPSFTLRDALFKDRWAKIVQRGATTSPDALKLAIIDADKLADDTLKQMGLHGDHMADRLEKLSPESVPAVDRLWRAHRLRNDLVHTPGFTLTETQAKHAIEDYAAFFRSIGLLREKGKTS